ncbi:AraC family transcriptional regulator [Falsibacillus pallidus]|uniref:AraC family transcriptional regulator n=1 Tax=Falsibacillus pallidus TaxID=493781 RepID=A0A370GQI4_9BACI|nr:AraC family transcriptional regulator [Falsibacillus pallidus]RDI45580.1 AraC family transcriptional regulator [Falsibacillus pallidus]
MGWVESLQVAIDFMEENLLEDISIEEISKATNSSPFHFQRTFSILTETSVGEYLRRRRLTLAAQDLCTSDIKIIDAAYKYGYDTPEAFAKAFRRQHGITPSEARKFMGKLNSYNRLVIQVNLKGAEPMQYTIVEKEAFRITGLSRRFSLLNGENEKGISLLWQEVNGDGTSEELAMLNNGIVKGLLGVCVASSEENEMDYWVAVARDGEVPGKFDSYEVPALKWAVFAVNGAMPHAIQNKWKEIFTEWFPSSGYQHAAGPELEVYPDGDPYSADYYSEIWIPVM